MEKSILTRDSGSLHNHTRKSRSIGWKLLREGRLDLLIKFWLMQLSDLGAEGIRRSGSYRFADHIYQNTPSGKGLLGKYIDQRLLQMPASQAFRRRYLRARESIIQHANTISGRTVKVMGIPCGLPRDVAELPGELQNRIEYTGMDLDEAVLKEAESFLHGPTFQSVAFVKGDALNASHYPNENEFDVIVSTGLGEFLDDDQLVVLYQNIHRALKPGGLFYTSATDCDPPSERLLRAMELETHYRDRKSLMDHFEKTRRPWSEIELAVDKTGLQTFVRAVKG